MSERDGGAGADIDGERDASGHDARGGFDARPVDERDDLALVQGYADVDDLDAFLDRLAAIGEEYDCVVQAFDAGLAAGERHLARAVDCARRAIEREESIARDPAVEVLCYAAGRRQIEDALEMGVGEGRQPVVVVVAAPPATGDPDANDGDDGTGEPDAELAGAADAVRDLLEPAELEPGTEQGDPERLRAFFGVGDAERRASDADLETLVCERVALLVVER